MDWSRATTSPWRARNYARWPGSSTPRIVVGIEDLTVPGPAGDLRARHYSPVNAAPVDSSRKRSSARPEPLLVFYHGGGFVLGDIETHDVLCRLICRDGGVHVLSIDYRLAPEHPVPAAVEDAYAAYRWAVDHADRTRRRPRTRGGRR